MSIIGLLTAALSLLLAVAFHDGYRFGVVEGVVALFGVTLVGMIAIRTSANGLLPRFLLLLYAAPFSTTLVYLFNRDWVWWPTPLARELITTPGVMPVLLTIGVIGVLGFVGGATLVGGRTALERERDEDVNTATLPALASLAMAGFAVLLMRLMTPEETFLTAIYALEQSSTAAAAANFNGANVLAYTTLLLLWIDAERDPLRRRRFIKATIIAAATVYIVVILQLLRGDRDCLGLLVAFGGLAVTRPGVNLHQVRRNFRKLAVPALVAVTIFFVIGGLRSTASITGEFAIAQSFIAGLSENTWTAVLLNNLGSAAQYQQGALDYLWGQTYLDYLLSLPPGPVARFIGVVRPLETTTGPGWWFIGLTGGGMHPAIVPFHNLGAVGVASILGLFGACTAFVESVQARHFLLRLLWSALLSSSFLWFWYGEMSMIRSVMAAAGLGLMYQLYLVAHQWFADNWHEIVATSKDHQSLRH
jgi:hypothetical protein